MSANSEQKKVIVKEIADKMRNAKGIVFFDYIGVNVEQVTKMRKEFRENGVDCKIYKNTLIKLAAQECGFDSKINDILNGSTAIAFGVNDPVAPAKVTKKYIDEFKKMELKAAIVENEYYDKAMTEKLATIPSKEELLAKMLGSLTNPLAGLARVLHAVAEKQGTPAAAESAEA